MEATTRPPILALPTPDYFQAHATRLFRYRFLLGLASLAMWAGLAVPVIVSTQRGEALPAAFPHLVRIGLPLVVWCWGLLLVALWFHPERGTLCLGQGRLRRCSARLQALLRAYTSVLLVAWFLAPLVVLLV